MTPTFKCIKKDTLHHAKVGDVIKMSEESLKGFDEKFKGWRDKYKQLSLEEELLELNKK